MAGTFRELREAFDKAAETPPLPGLGDLLLARYELLLKHKAETDEDRAHLVETLHACSLKLMKKYTGPNPRYWLEASDERTLAGMFRALTLPESLRHVPPAAPAALAEAAGDLISRGETILDSQTGNTLEEYRRTLVSYARMAMAAADAFRETQGQDSVDIKTTRDLVPGKRLIIRQKEPPTS